MWTGFFPRHTAILTFGGTGVQTLPNGVMLVYTNLLYLALVSCVALGAVLGYSFALYLTNRRCISCVAKDCNILKANATYYINDEDLN
jgi:hypothetical protein